MKTIIKKYVINITVFLLSLFSSIVVAIEKKSIETNVLSEPNYSDPNMAGNLIQTTLGLFVVLALIGVAAWAFKRFGHFQTGVHGKMKIIGGLSLGSRERVVLLQIGEKQLVVGVTSSHIQTLHVLDEALPDEDTSEKGTGFSAKLQAAITNRNGHSQVSSEKL